MDYFPMTAEEEAAIATLRNRGCAVVVWTPPELSDKSPDYTGDFTDENGTKMRVAAWVKPGSPI